MLQLLSSNPLAFLISAVGLVIAITIHEFAHAWTADRLGDPTPRMQERVTLNPLAHLDPVGTIALLLVGFGWGRPVEFDPYNLKHKTRDAALIALAGPASNLILALLLSILINVFFPATGIITIALTYILYINVMLAIFNLIPVAPLDGEKVLQAILPRELAIEYRQFMRQYGMFVLILLIFPIFNNSSAVSRLIQPIIQFIVGILV